MGGVLLTLRDEDIIRILTARVRVMSVRQIARAFWPDLASDKAMAAAEARLRTLEAAGHIELFSAMTHPEIPLHAPVARWQPGLAAPEFEPVSWMLRARWKHPETATLLVAASERAGLERGGHGGRRPRTSEATHDLHLAAVYLEMWTHLPTRARTWRSEAAIVAGRDRVSRAQKLPDALVRDGRALTAIEFGGAYAAEKVAEFHDYCARLGYGYEVW